MSGDTMMYALKPVVSMPRDIYQPKTMYAIKNINGLKQQQLAANHTNNGNKIVSDITEQSPLPEVAQLEIRQEKILAQLAELKEQVSSLCGILKGSSKSKSTSNAGSGNVENVHTELVINANPSKPPFSILALQKIWRNTDVRVSSHIHSSISSQAPEFPLLSESRKDASNTVDVSLIWKNVTDVEIVASALLGTPLLGEVNLLRYLSRLISSQNYEESESIVESSKIDAVLDLCHQLSFQESPKDTQSVLSTLAGKIGSGKWLLGRSEPSIADIATWSAIRRLDVKKLPGNLTEWFKRCDDLFWQQ